MVFVALAAPGEGDATAETAVPTLSRSKEPRPRATARIAVLIETPILREARRCAVADPGASPSADADLKAMFT